VLTYLVINIGYCIKFKHIPQIDIVCVASGFTIRALIGAFCVGTGVNFWLLAAVVFACMGLAVMKRMKELKGVGATGETRPVLSRYDYDTLLRSHDMFMVLSVLSVTLFLEDRSHDSPLASAAMLTFMSAVLLAFIDRVQATADGDPTNLIYKHKYLSAAVVLLGVTFVLVK
jgi:4-hydroxybenzoate polyprenyltransferase